MVYAGKEIVSHLIYLRIITWCIISDETIWPYRCSFLHNLIGNTGILLWTHWKCFVTALFWVIWQEKKNHTFEEDLWWGGLGFPPRQIQMNKTLLA